MTSLPSKKVISVLIIAIAIIFVSIFFSRGNDQEEDSGIYITTEPILSADRQSDIDGDGLLDWEEDAWETNMSLADTDGDGTNDGDEVRRGRNPLIVGPNDFIEDGTRESLLVEQKLVSDNFEEGTISDNLSKRLFSDYLTLQQDGSLGTKGGEEVLQNIVMDAADEVSFDIIYSQDDLQTFDAENSEQLKIYANSFADIEIQRLLALAQLPEDADSIQLIVDINTNHAQSLSSILVPDILVYEHLSIINGYTTFSEALVNLKEAQTDPVKAVVSMGVLEEIESSQNLALSVIGEYFRERGIIFGEDDSGILWDQY